MSVRETAIRKHNKSQDAHDRGSAICCISPGRQGIQEGGVQRLYQIIKVQLQAFRAPGEGPGDRACPGKRNWQGPAGDAHFLRRRGGAAGDAGIKDGFLHDG